LYTLAIETGGTKLQLFLGTSQGEIVYKHYHQVEPNLGRKGTLDAIEAGLPILREAAEKLGGSIEKVAIGFGGIVDYPRGVTIASAQISGWDQFPLRDYLQETMGIPAFVFNDTDAATWGEYVKGAGRNCHTFMYTNIGSGTGGGVVIDGKLYIGQGLGGMEIGQTFVHNMDSADSMDFIQMEHLCSGWGMESRLRKADIPESSALWRLCEMDQQALTCKMLATALHEGDPFATDFFDRTIHVYAISLANAINLLAPEVVAIGGGVSLIGAPLFSRVEAYVAKYVANNVKNRYKIVPCELGVEIVPIGALLLANN